MPAKTPHIDGTRAARRRAWGAQIRARRKSLQVSVTAAAESAGMSRGTWHRIENGETSVRRRGYAMAMSVLGLEAGTSPQAVPPKEPVPVDAPRRIPESIRLSEHPELKTLAWHVQGSDELSPVEAMGLYERNARHLDDDALLPHERDLIDALRMVFGPGNRDG